MPNKKYVITAYAQDPTLPLITREAASKLSHLNVAFGLVRDGEVHVDHLENLHCLETIRQYNTELKILLSIGGWGAGGFSEAAGTMHGQQVFAKTAVAILKAHHLDGLDLDWEYPCHSQANIGSSPDDKYTFTLLLAEMRRQLDEQGTKDRRHYLLTIAVGADQFFIDGTEMDKVQACLDLVQIMTYDMRGGFQTVTGHHTNLFTPTGDLFRISVDASVNMYLRAGVPHEKIVIGAAFYSRKWTGVPNRHNGLHQMAASNGGFGPGYSELVADFINKDGYKRYWDNEAKAPYLFDGSTFISYDDEMSVHEKCEYIKHTEVAGIMYWEHGFDPAGNLLDVMFDSLGPSGSKTL